MAETRLRRGGGNWKAAAASVVCVACLVCAGGTGCTYQRPARVTVEPTYSYSQVSPELTREQIWPVSGPRTVRVVQREDAAE